MSISLFRTFISISEEGTFRAAADKIGVTHVAVGQQMRRLEGILGVTVFDRTQKSPQLNQLGRGLIPKMKDVVTAYDAILNDLTGDPRLIGDISLGAVPSTIRGLIPQSLKRLVEIYPDLRVRVIPGLSANVQEMVERGVIDAAVLSEPVRIPATMNWMPFAVEELVLLTSQDVVETDVTQILTTMPFIRHTSLATVGLLAEDWLSKQQFTVRDTMEMNSLDTVASMVAHNLGVSVGPNMCVPDPVFESLRKLPLGDQAPSRTLGILTRSDSAKLRLVERLVEQLRITANAPAPFSGSESAAAEA